MTRFSLRDLFWLMLVVAMGVAWWVDHRNVTQREVTFEIRHPSNLASPVLVRLRIDRLMAYNLSKSDVMRAAMPSGFVGYPPAPPDVVFSDLPLKLETYPSIIVRANAAGEIIRLKDVGKVEYMKNASY